MAISKKCENAPCTCPATNGSAYCSAYCAGAEERTDVVCHCGHLECEGDVTEADAPEDAASVA